MFGIVPPQPSKEPPRPPQLSQSQPAATTPSKPRKKRSPEEIEQRKKRVAEKEKAIVDLEEKIRILKLEIDKSKAELNSTMRKASIVTKATQTQDVTEQNQSHVTKMREVFSSNKSVNQIQNKILGQVFQYESSITGYYNNNDNNNSQKSESNNSNKNTNVSQAKTQVKTLTKSSPVAPLNLVNPRVKTSSLPIAKKSVSTGAAPVKIIRPAPLPPGYDAPQAPKLHSSLPLPKHKTIQRTLSNIINDKNKISITFINPEPYSKNNASKYLYLLSLLHMHVSIVYFFNYYILFYL